MQDKIARQVHQVFGYGLELKERLERGERPHFEAEQTKLRGLLLGYLGRISYRRGILHGPVQHSMAYRLQLLKGDFKVVLSLYQLGIFFLSCCRAICGLNL